MLETPEKTVNVQNLLKLADHLDGVAPSDFNIALWSACIVGHCQAVFPAEDPGFVLGLSHDQYRSLFIPKVAPFIVSATPKMAARVVRHLALTGEVDWGQATREDVA